MGGDFLFKFGVIGLGVLTAALATIAVFSF